MVEMREGPVQVRFEIRGENTTVFVIPGGGRKVQIPEASPFSELVDPVVKEDTLGPVIQDLIKTHGEDMDVSGYESRLRAELVTARKIGREHDEFSLQLDSAILEARKYLEGATLGSFPKVASIIQAKISQMAEDVWTEDLEKTEIKP